MRSLRRVRSIALIVLAVLCVSGTHAAAAPEGTLTIAMHFTPVPRWLDPADGESTITPFFLLYALHDALLKPMSGVGSCVTNAPSEYRRCSTVRTMKEDPSGSAIMS